MKQPPTLDGCDIIILDPMLATSGSAACPIKAVFGQQRQPDRRFRDF